MEKKYRYRKDGDGGKIENEDIADVYNTVLKIAKKRAHIDATLTVTGAADLFTQDLIDEDDAGRDAGKQDGARPNTGAANLADRLKQSAKPEGDVVRGLVEDVAEHPPKGAQKSTRYGIKVAGKIYGTFKKEHADIARDARTQGKPVALAWLKNGDFFNVASINVEDAPPLNPEQIADIEAREAKEAGRMIDGGLL
jgi:hypothetical protein